ncbi:MAG: beta-galactosidase [Muribaculaceae bacterium]|nr:beta-galactosidase [Muribaculaceae bacterium]
MNRMNLISLMSRINLINLIRRKNHRKSIGNIVLPGMLAALAVASAAAGRFTPGKGEFLLDGEPFVIKAAELHYPRIPRPYWDHRIKMAKALGMNTICMYVFWNAHESTPDTFDFTGQNDIAEFVRLCQENNMYVILRPGPYVCAEWEMGGLPWWLLQDKDIRLRENDPRFLERVAGFEKAVARQLSPHTIDNGGPILMIQVENEYGSYGKDKEYVGTIRDMLRKEYGEDVEMFQCDWSSNFLDNGLDDLTWTLNFGTGADIDREFAPLRESRPDSPLMCSEFWSGWFDKWGAGHETRPADAMVQGISDMLEKGISFSLYMTHGGTNWGHWAGANSPGYAPDVTSYDYDAPISENGTPTQKYHLLRTALSHHAGDELPAVPDTIPTIAVDRFNFTQVAPLLDNLPEPHRDRDIRTMEEYGFGYGSILYSTTLPTLPEGTLLTVDEPHDFAQILLDGTLIGTLDRRLGEKDITLPEVKGSTRLDILVEATGRINFGRAIKDFKGISEDVTITLPGTPEPQPVKEWMVYPLEDSPAYYDSLRFIPLAGVESEEGKRLPRGAYRGTFTLTSPSDTFLDFSSWGKGLVYVNGHGIGRIWHIGPQQTLYVPGCWLREGENDIMVFDILGPEEVSSEGLRAPILDSLRPLTTEKEAAGTPDLSRASILLQGTFSGDRGWQRAEADSAASGRYAVVEFTCSHDGGDILGVAELYLIGADGTRLSREAWKSIYADSSVTQGNHTPDKAFDLQESTYWLTQEGKEYPHLIVIDMGGDYEVKGIEYLPRMESGVKGSASGFRLFLSGEGFPLLE